MRQVVFQTAQPGKQHGFILVLTLWIMVIVSIAAGYFSERVARSIELAQQSRQNTRAIIDMAGTKAEILYRLGTVSLTEYGAGRGNTAIALDNRPYYGFGKTIIRLQDTRGLLNLNLTEDSRMQRFLGLLEIPAEQRGPMIDTLRDFIDEDKLHRLNGAEDDEYRAQGLPPPPNRNLVTPWESKRIIGWRNAPELWKNGRLVELTTTSFSVGINPNTAPADVLATLPGVTEEFAQAIIARRQLSPITQEGQIVEITSTPLNLGLGTGIIAIPSDTIRITQSTQGVPWALQYIIKLTPNDKDAPWQTDYYSRVSLDRRDETKADIQELPARSSALPDKMPNFLFGG
ncbi:MAG: type II secretion system protein GspK [Gallionella sp.]|nr:type II secretion system protein GspK [Gallionella sp.]